MLLSASNLPRKKEMLAQYVKRQKNEPRGHNSSWGKALALDKLILFRKERKSQCKETTFDVTLSIMAAVGVPWPGKQRRSNGKGWTLEPICLDSKPSPTTILTTDSGQIPCCLSLTLRPYL